MEDWPRWLAALLGAAAGMAAYYGVDRWVHRTKGHDHG